MTTLRVEGDEANRQKVAAVHPVWCTETSLMHGNECSGDSESVTGVNLGSAAYMWLTTEPGGWARPVAQVELTKEMDLPASGVFLDVAGLRALADMATRLADTLESER